MGAWREENVRARHNVDARGDHRGRVNQRADRRGAFHRIGQPDVQRKLRGLTRGAHEEQQASDGERAELPHGVRLPCGGLGEDGLEIQRTECAEEQEHPQHETEIADAVDDERLLARIRRGLLQEVEADQQVAAQAHAFPAYEEEHEIGGENENQHEEHEQIQVGEEAVVAAFVRHVARGIDVDQEADAGDDQHHHDGELVQLQIESRAEIAGDDPIEELLAERRLATGEEFAHGFQRAGEGEARGAQCDAGNELVGPLRAKQAVDG